MTTHKTRKALVLCLSLALAIFIAATVAAKRQRRDAAKVGAAISKVERLEIIDTAVKLEDGPSPTVVVEVFNNSDKGIVAISVESGDEKDSSGICIESFPVGDEPPPVVLEAYGSKKIELPLSNLLPGKSLKVSGVMYADGTVEGEAGAKRRIQGYKERVKKK